MTNTDERASAYRVIQEGQGYNEKSCAKCTNCERRDGAFAVCKLNPALDVPVKTYGRCDHYDPA